MKFAKVGYGSNGQGLGKTANENPSGYTYLVNDTVRTGDRIQPIATNWKNGKKFATTGKVLHSFNENSVKGQQAKKDVADRIKGDYKDMVEKVHSRYGEKRIGEMVDRYLTQDRLDKMAQQKITTVKTGKELGVSGYRGSPTRQQEVRAAQIGAYAQEHPKAQFSQNAVETFDTYSKKYNQ